MHLTVFPYIYFRTNSIYWLHRLYSTCCVNFCFHYLSLRFFHSFVRSLIPILIISAISIQEFADICESLNWGYDYYSSYWSNGYYSLTDPFKNWSWKCTDGVNSTGQEEATQFQFQGRAHQVMGARCQKGLWLWHTYGIDLTQEYKSPVSYHQWQAQP